MKLRKRLENVERRVVVVSSRDRLCLSPYPVPELVNPAIVEIFVMMKKKFVAR